MKQEACEATQGLIGSTLQDTIWCPIIGAAGVVLSDEKRTRFHLTHIFLHISPERTYTMLGRKSYTQEELDCFSHNEVV
ncbi:hypothetical protein, partial [Alicyclobacillus shizuokensis]|uniref:hypothetical protein n=1 Tax=Alicyclobacillus shizuokensis TaxID=392014 RepID=UPI001C3F2164